MLDNLLLAEDSKEYISSYIFSLKSAGFEVTHVTDGGELYLALQKNIFNVVLSDSEMHFMRGYEACNKAITENILDPNRTLIIGMSEDPENQNYWRGLAHLSCFLNKDYFPREKIGQKVRQSLKNFRAGGLWKEKMPLIE